jgi:homocysteine S-methyltransferase
MLDAFAGVEVVGVNCTAPAAVTSLVGALRSGTAKPILVCPNLGQHWETDMHALAGGAAEAEFLRYVPEWLELGVAHIGGCCGVRPSMIRALAAAVVANACVT